MDEKKIPNVTEVYGTVAKTYAQFRPRYPPHLFSFLSSLTPQHDLAWDVGTGTGQAAIELSKYYARVVGTDTSEGQIQHAEQQPHITYRRDGAVIERPATALHRRPRIFRGSRHRCHSRPLVKRVLKKPGGVIAVWAYWKPSVDPAVDAVFERFFSRFYPFSHPAWKLLLEDYESLPFPFAQVEGIKMEIEEQRTSYEYVGYFRTRHALVGREELLNEFSAEVEAAWGAPLHVTKAVKFPLCLKIGKV